MRDLTYLKLLAREYPSVKAATSEIINLMALCGRSFIFCVVLHVLSGRRLGLN